MFPLNVLEIVAGFLDARDAAGFECVCKATRDICKKKSHVRAIVIPANRETMASFVRWFAGRLKYIHQLELVTDMALWSHIWRYSGVKIALNLKEAHMYHTGPNLIVHSPEDILPTSPFLEHLTLCAEDFVHVGEGMSRLRLKRLAIHSSTSYITSEVRTYVIPTLEKLYLHGNLSETLTLSGLAFTKLRHLEGPAILLASVIPLLRHLKSIVLHGGLPIEFFKSHSIELQSQVEFVRLIQGYWVDLSWIPLSVNTLECISCVCINNIPTTGNIKNLLLLYNSFGPDAAQDISRMKLDTLTLRSFGVGLPVISVRPGCVVDVSEDDSRYIKLLS
jgi:hypothetical protein